MKSLSRIMPPTKVQPRPIVPLYQVPTAVEPPTLTVSYHSCFYTFRPRPIEFFDLVERLRTVAIFTGEPVMTYKDASGKLRYIADFHEMTRAYSNHPSQLTVDLRFD